MTASFTESLNSGFLIQPPSALRLPQHIRKDTGQISVSVFGIPIARKKRMVFSMRPFWVEQSSF